MTTAHLEKTRSWLRDFLKVTEEEWAHTPKLWEEARRRLRRLPSGLEPALVREFYRGFYEGHHLLTWSFPWFSAEMPGEYFEIYGRLRIERAIAALAADISEGLVAETAFLFDCKSGAEMATYAHVVFDEPERRKYLARQRLVEQHQRFVSVSSLGVERFRPLALEPAILEAARHLLANDFFLAFHRADEERYARRSDPRRLCAGGTCELKLWAACKLVLRLAGEQAIAPGVEPPPHKSA